MLHLLIFALLLIILPSSSVQKVFRNPDKIELAFDGVKWHSFEGQYRNYELFFHDDGVCAKTTESYYIFWKEILRNCLYKDAKTGNRQFIFCKNDENCEVLGEMEEKKKGAFSWLGFGSIVFLYKFKEQNQIISRKESGNELTYIKFFNVANENREQQIAKIEIYGQGNNLGDAEKVTIYRFSDEIDMKFLLLIAAQNMKTYAKNLFKRAAAAVALNIVKQTITHLYLTDSKKDEN